MTRTDLRLESRWTAAEGDAPALYLLTLFNHGTDAVSGFRLCLSGPARLDPKVDTTGARLTKRLSNHSEFTPDAGYVLQPGGALEISTTGLSYPLRHWSDGATTAYVALDDGTILPVSVAPTVRTRDNAPLRRGAARFSFPAKAPASLSVIPWPADVAVEGARPVPPGLAVHTDNDAGRMAAAAFAALTDALFPVEGLVRPESEGGAPVICALAEGLGAEGYRIELDAVITVHAATQTGFLYGLVTLGQMLRGARTYPDRLSLPASGRVADTPRMGWRGCHLDVARQFYAVSEIRQLLRIMAWNKLNRFHWHLTEDEAWRIEISAFPQLTDIGAWRGHGLPIPPLLGSGPGRTGGYYSREAVAGVVALAADLGIEVIPEIDIPGHSFAMLAALPQLRDPGETGEYASVQGFPNNCLNPAHEATYPVLEKIIDELVEMFPSGIIHVGADEVPLAAWSGSPLALDWLRKNASSALADAHGLLKNTVGNHGGADAIEGSATAVLQAAFLKRVQDHIAGKGCITGGWEEAAHGDVIDKDQSYLVGWRDVAVSGKLAAEGYNIVVSPGQAYYLDMSQSLEWAEPGAAWAGWSGPKETYDFDPVAGWTDTQLTRFMGIQACIWSEPMTDRAVFDRLVFPRLSAIAETAWTAADRKSWDRFAAFSSLMPILYGHWES